MVQKREKSDRVELAREHFFIPLTELVNRENIAFLIIDMQKIIENRIYKGYLHQSERWLETGIASAEYVKERLAIAINDTISLLNFFRSNNLMVIYTRMGHLYKDFSDVPRVRKKIFDNMVNCKGEKFYSTPVTGMHASIVYKLRQHYGLDSEGEPVKVVEPYQMLGEIKDDLKEVLGVDCATLEGKGTFFEFNKENWKEWQLNDGTPVLVPQLFNTIKNKDGSVFQYPEGDKNYPPSLKMLRAGFFFDAIIRQENFDEKNLDPKDNLEEFSIISEKDLNYLKKQFDHLYNNTNYAIVGMLADTSFGDIAFIPGIKLKSPKGIRNIEEWYISLHTRKNHVKKIFEGQLEVAIENYRRIFKEIGNNINVVLTSAADFGMQRGLFISTNTYRELFKPFHLQLNNWIHENTSWKSFIHTCGGVFELIPDLIEAGFDILNPVQISAHGMNPEKLKSEYGNNITFWGGGVDTQKTLAFGTTGDVRKRVRELVEIFFKNGGFVFNTVHNIQANVPIENVIAMIETIKEYR